MWLFGSYFYDLTRSFKEYSTQKDATYLISFILAVVIPVVIIILIRFINVYNRRSTGIMRFRLKKFQNYANAMGLCRIGEAYYNKEMYVQAIEASQKALKHDPQLAYAYKILGKAYHKTGKLKEALLNFERSLTLDPYQADVCVELGSCYYQMKGYDTAVTYFKQAVALNKHYDEAYFYLGCILGDIYLEYEEAIEMFHEYIKFVPLSKKAVDAKRLIYKYRKQLKS